MLGIFVEDTSDIHALQRHSSRAAGRTCQWRIGSYKYEVCGQVNVINLFRDEDKRAKIFVAIRAD